MEPITLFIGKISAIYWLTYGLGFLISKKFYADQLKNSDKTDSLAITLQGAIHLYIGAAILTNHFLWDNLLAILVTILGFMYLAKGIALIVFPGMTLKSTDASAKLVYISSFGFILLGLILGYLSFFA
jgi:NhaP-type Na+/H+ or K+/H+ antiporter